MNDHASSFLQAAKWIAAADSLIIAAGAGMGVDSGLPDFRGSEGFWRAYPALAEAHIQFQQIACPAAFHETPERAWGFYGHRLELYRRTVPHKGFAILRDIADRLPLGALVFTSNVDGQFQKAGFGEENIYECHGSIHHLQCLRPCAEAIWEAAFVPEVDEAVCLMSSPLPLCPDCGSLARPNVLMFGDWDWLEQRSMKQMTRLRQWRQGCTGPVVIELGAGIDIPTVRHYSETQNAPLIRINPRAPEIPRHIEGVSLPMGAKAGLEGISDALSAIGFRKKLNPRLL